MKEEENNHKLLNINPRVSNLILENRTINPIRYFQKPVRCLSIEELPKKSHIHPKEKRNQKKTRKCTNWSYNIAAKKQLQKSAPHTQITEEAKMMIEEKHCTHGCCCVHFLEMHTWCLWLCIRDEKLSFQSTRGWWSEEERVGI